jgi:peroxiredoxin
MAAVLHDPTQLPDDLPVPQDDGAARHLFGMRLPDVVLSATDGAQVNLSRLVARGCTPQSCGFRDHFAELKRLGVNALYGLSTQDTAYQREAVERLHLPFAILSDEKLQLTRAMRLPTFHVDGMTLIKRMAWVVDDGVIAKTFYPVFPPDKSAEDVVCWLQASR